MNMLRTTITLREDVYDELRKLAAAKRMSMSDIVNARLSNTNYGLSQEEVQKKIERAEKMLDSLASKGKPGVDVVKAVREMRDE